MCNTPESIDDIFANRAAKGRRMSVRPALDMIMDLPTEREKDAEATPLPMPRRNKTVPASMARPRSKMEHKPSLDEALGD